MQRLNGVDLFRFIAAFFILILHTNYGPLEDTLGVYAKLSARWAVPFFFLCSGYFLQKKLEKSEHFSFDVIQKNVISLISILLVSSLIYGTIDTIRGNYEFQIPHVLVGAYFHLWYIGAMIFAFITIWYLHEVKLQFILPYLSILLLGGLFLSDNYDFLFQKDYSFEVYRFMQAIPFIYIGMRVCKIKNTDRIKTTGWITLFGGILFLILEVKLFKWIMPLLDLVHEQSIGISIIAIGAFLVSLSIDIDTNFFTKFGQKYSLFSYLYHPLLYMGFSVLFPIFLPENGFSKLLYPILGYSLILGIAYILDTKAKPVFNVLNGKIK
jgi:surface polysaccharide O-acyltransferase-like enzyme